MAGARCRQRAVGRGRRDQLQLRDNVGEEARRFPAAMREQATTAAQAFAAAALRAAEHVAIIDDTLGARPALAGTQAGGYPDPTAR